MATLSPALEAIIQLVECRCAWERCPTNLCQCRKADLLCKDPRSCSDNNHECENKNQQCECDNYDGDTEDEKDEDEEDDDDDHVQPYHRGINFKKVSKLLRFSGPASLSC